MKARGKLKQAIIAVLFSSGIEVSRRKLRKILEAEKKGFNMAVKQAGNDLRGLGLTIISGQGKLQLVTSAESAFFVEKFLKSQVKGKLGRASMEALAVVAYRGWATKEEIELIRGVNSTQTVRSLMIKGLIEKKDKNGLSGFRPTLSFFRLAGVKKLEDLPKYEKMRNDGRIESFLRNS